MSAERARGATVDFFQDLPDGAKPYIRPSRRSLHVDRSSFWGSAGRPLTSLEFSMSARSVILDYLMQFDASDHQSLLSGLADWLNANPSQAQSLGDHVRVTTGWEPRFGGIEPGPNQVTQLELCALVRRQHAHESARVIADIAAAVFSETYPGYDHIDPQQHEDRIARVRAAIDAGEIPTDAEGYALDLDDDDSLGLSEAPWRWIVWSPTEWVWGAQRTLIPAVCSRGQAASAEAARLAAEAAARSAGWVVPVTDTVPVLRHAAEVMMEVRTQMENEQLEDLIEQIEDEDFEELEFSDDLVIEVTSERMRTARGVQQVPVFEIRRVEDEES